MMTDWYLKIANKEMGPLSSQQLKAMAKQGQFGPEDLIRQAGSGPWIAAGRVRGLLSTSVMATSDSSLSTAKAVEETGEVVKSPSQAETTTVIPPKPQPAASKAAIPVGASLPSDVPPTDSVIPIALPVVTPVLAGSVASPPIVEPPVSYCATQTAASAAATLNRADAKRERQRQQKVLVVGLFGSLVLLAGVAAIVVVSTCGNSAVKSSSDKKSSSPPTTTEPQSFMATEDIDVLDSLKGIETAVLATRTAGSSKDANGWIDARTESASFGPVKVKVKAVEVGKARFTRLTETCLAVHLELSNSHETKLYQYTPWRRQAGISLIDEFDNSYAQRAVKQTRGGSIYPGKSLDETIFFRPPVAKATSLRLQLPAAAFNEDGMIRFQIPVNMIQKVEAITGTISTCNDSLPANQRESEGNETTAVGENPPQREEPHINRAFMKANQQQEPAKPAATKVSNLSSLQKEIEKLDGDDMEAEVTDFESDPEAVKKIEAMDKQTDPPASKKRNRRSRGG